MIKRNLKLIQNFRSYPDNLSQIQVDGTKKAISTSDVNEARAGLLQQNLTQWRLTDSKGRYRIASPSQIPEQQTSIRTNDSKWSK